eukprot:GHVN01099227.1.p2 GENE.GHVN01099227.1~~GHVN01099227.1.p2  ORF type:complete len:317 (-),score=92.10 GHVN01099227.1:784-1734(-)
MRPPPSHSPPNNAGIGSHPPSSQLTSRRPLTVNGEVNRGSLAVGRAGLPARHVSGGVGPVRSDQHPSQSVGASQSHPHTGFPPPSFSYAQSHHDTGTPLSYQSSHQVSDVTSDYASRQHEADQPQFESLQERDLPQHQPCWQGDPHGQSHDFMSPHPLPHQPHRWTAPSQPLTSDSLEDLSVLRPTPSPIAQSPISDRSPTSTNMDEGTHLNQAKPELSFFESNLSVHSDTSSQWTYSSTYAPQHGPFLSVEDLGYPPILPFMDDPHQSLKPVPVFLLGKMKIAPVDHCRCVPVSYHHPSQIRMGLNKGISILHKH